MKDEIDKLREEFNRLNSRLDELEGKVKQGECPYWEGMLIEVREHECKDWGGPRRFVRLGKTGGVIATSGSSEIFWRLYRPYEAEGLIQFKPHKPGDPMPCDGEEKLYLRFNNGEVLSGYADNFRWDIDVAGWAPICGWREYFKRMGWGNE